MKVECIRCGKTLESEWDRSMFLGRRKVYICEECYRRSAGEVIDCKKKFYDKHSIEKGWIR